MDLAPRSLSWCLAAGVSFLLTFGALSVSAEPRNARPFNGSFQEWSLRGGPTLGGLDGGWTADAGFRHSFPMYLGDTRLSYRFAGGGIDGEAHQIHGLHFTLGIHPFYLALLSQGLVSHFLASLHAELGLGAQLGVGEGVAAGFAPSVGAGFDLPITEANRGRGVWLNALYRRTWTTLSGPESGRLHDHAFFVGLAWRINGPLF